ncbi:MAG: tetratricopeptide repeat protein, partial [Planctomycetota bacterium]|nr:tetratricopeptide repeat protein [Planctomycetota bacterium]
QADDVRRLAVERAIREGWVKVPHSIRIDLLLDMSAIAAAAGDAQAAQRFAAEARSILDANRWIAESEVPMLGRIATAFANAGADEAARAAIERAEEVHGTRLQEIYDIYRAGALRPVAEAWVAVGDADRARAMYLRALASGMENPNARPRAIDLAATARSMAASGFQPDAELLEEMRAIRTRLGDPW